MKKNSKYNNINYLKKIKIQSKNIHKTIHILFFPIFSYQY